jgi:iron complex transport system ATP-binding protein
MYDLRSVSFRSGDATVVRDASLRIERGTFCAVLGPKGAGKSTLLRLLAGQLVPTTGTVRLLGRNVCAFDACQLQSERARFAESAPSSFALGFNEIVALGRYRTGAARPSPGTVEHVLEEVAALQLAALRYESLSGAEADAGDVARVLMQESDVVLLDEPTRYVDARREYDALHAIHRLTVRGATVVAVLNDFTAAAHFADRVVLMRGGRIAAQGNPETVLQPRLLEAVFGIPQMRRATA